MEISFTTLKYSQNFLRKFWRKKKGKQKKFFAKKWKMGEKPIFVEKQEKKQIQERRVCKAHKCVNLCCC